MNWELTVVRLIEMVFLGVGSWMDLKDQDLPIKFLAVFSVVAVACNGILKYQSIKNMMISGALGGIFLLVGWFTKEAIGYGDGIGLVILGIFEGWQGMIPIVFGAFLLSGIYGIWKMIGLKESGSSTMPFYPFLFLGLMGVIFL